MARKRDYRVSHTAHKGLAFASATPHAQHSQRTPEVAMALDTRNTDEATERLLRQLVEEQRLQGHTLNEISRYTFWLALAFSFVVVVMFIWQWAGL